MTEERFCTYCERPAVRGDLCATHLKRHQRGATPEEMRAPLTEKLSPTQRLLESAVAWVESDPEDDAEYESTKRAVINAARALGRDTAEQVRSWVAQARQRGVRFGRRPSVTYEQAFEAVNETGGTRSAAVKLGVSRNAVRRALRKGGGSEKRDCGPTNTQPVHEDRET